jgi:5-methylcytosine-specific restriction endonuclease McrA
MSIRKLSEAKKKNVAGKQYFKCANKPGTKIRGLGGYKCPLWNKLGENKGSFDESGYEIDHIIEYSVSKNDETENLQALCGMCHKVKNKTLHDKR